MWSGEQPGEWVLLSYRLPREPSTPRITVWRKLKRHGVAQLGDGLVGLPADARTREHLEWIAEDITNADGSAMVWLARPTTVAQERELARGLAEARRSEYLALTQAAANVAGEPGSPARALAVRRLRAQLRQIERRDYFPPPERRAARAAIDALLIDTDQEQTG